MKEALSRLPNDEGAGIERSLGGQQTLQLAVGTKAPHLSEVILVPLALAKSPGPAPHGAQPDHPHEACPNCKPTEP